MKHFQYITVLSWKELCQAAYKLKSNLPLCFQLARLKRDALKCLGLNSVRQVILKNKSLELKKKYNLLSTRNLSHCTFSSWSFALLLQPLHLCSEFQALQIMPYSAYLKWRTFALNTLEFFSRVSDFPNP